MLQQHPSLEKLLQTSVVIIEKINVYTCEICETVYCTEESLVRHLVKHMKCKGTLENNTESTPRSNQKKPDSTSTCATSRKPSSVDNDMYSKTRQPQISIRDRIRFESDSDDAQGDTDSSEDNTTGDFEPLKIEQDASSSSSEVLNMSVLGKTSQHCKENESKPSSVPSKLTKQRQATITSGADNCGQQVSFQTGHRQSQTVKQYTCNKCQKSFSRRRGLDAHEKLHRLEKTLKCKFCEKMFMFKHQLKVHQRIHTDERPYSCIVCNKSFSYWFGLSLHKRSYHPNLYDPLEATAQPTCAICNKRFSQKYAVMKHIYLQHTTTGYPCSICRKEFGHPVVRDMHMILHKASFKCSVCGRCFQNRDYLTRCELSHKKPYECPNCTFKFGRKYHLERHMKEACKGLNQRETPFKCTNCSKKFARKYQLTSHIKYHCKPHECARCKKRFAEATTLKIHLNNKTCKIRKMYECDMCNKRFSRKIHLLPHINIHCKKKTRAVLK